MLLAPQFLSAGHIVIMQWPSHVHEAFNCCLPLLTHDQALLASTCLADNPCGARPMQHDTRSLRLQHNICNCNTLLVLYCAWMLHQRHIAAQAWAAQYNTWLLINLTPKCVVFYFIIVSFCTGALRRGAASDLGRGDRHSHARRGRNSNRHNERETQKSMTDLDDDDNFSMRFQTLDEVVGQVCSCVAFECFLTADCNTGDIVHLNFIY